MSEQSVENAAPCNHVAGYYANPQSGATCWDCGEVPDTETDAPEVEWIVALRMPPRDVGGLSLHQCSACCALVVEDFMPDHEEWHARVIPPAKP